MCPIYSMTFYLVKATPKGNIGELREDIDNGMISNLVPFGKSLQYSLENAKLDNGKYAVWIEEDYCSPSLAMEREVVLDRFFDNIKVEVVSSEEDGWSKIRDRQPFWTILSKLRE